MTEPKEGAPRPWTASEVSLRDATGTLLATFYDLEANVQAMRAVNAETARDARERALREALQAFVNAHLPPAGCGESCPCLLCGSARAALAASEKES